MAGQGDRQADFQAMRVASALRELLATGYDRTRLRADILAGLTLGIVAMPLGMALAIATGVAPQFGLYTVVVAGFLIALAGGSRFNISGPTAAFVVILLPIVHAHGLGGLLVATVMAGLILVAMGLLRFGRAIEFIPYPVIIGFTTGIGVVIAALQLRDFFGLSVAGTQEHFLDKMQAIFAAAPTLRWQDTLVAALTLAVMLLWPKLKTRLPAHLVALLAAVGAVFLLQALLPGFSVETIGSRFTWEVDGVSGTGIPPFAPQFVLPWALPAADGQPLGLSFALVRELLPSALVIAMLGAIESLLCAVVADGFAGTRHNPNAELVGQGLGNIAAPFFGGITATAAMARTATSVRAGATSPVAGMVHALTVLVAIVVFAPALAYIPMAALAALLVVVAWNMAEVQHFRHILTAAPRSDVAVLLTCFGLTVLFDMVLAVGVGLLLAAFLFIRRMVELTGVELVTAGHHRHVAGLPAGVVVYDINGPLFFGAARRALDHLDTLDRNLRVVVLDMADVNTMDITGMVALESVLARMRKRGIAVVLTGLAPALRTKLARAGIVADDERLFVADDTAGLVALAQRLVAA